MRPARLLTLGLLLLPALALRAAAGDAAAPPPSALRFRFEKLKSDAGVIRCALYASPKEHLDRSFREAPGAIQGGQATCAFAAVPPGTYSMCAFHDENNNGKLDTNFLGIPKEGVVCSNQARGRMGPPRWKDAQFRYDGGAYAPPPLVMRY